MTALLLDTQVALWWHTRDRRLTPDTRTAMQEAAGCHVSAASSWELAVKLASGAVRVDWQPGVSFASLCSGYGFTLTEIAHEDAWAVNSLPTGPGDLFDRLIAATALRRGLTVVSADPVFADLGVDLIAA